MNTFKTLAPRVAIAAGFAFAAASLYAFVGQSQAETRALSFCAATKPGQSVQNVLSRMSGELDAATAFESQKGVSLVYGKASQYVCDVRFKGNEVAVASVSALD